MLVAHDQEASAVDCDAGEYADVAVVDGFGSVVRFTDQGGVASAFGDDEQ